MVHPNEVRYLHLLQGSKFTIMVIDKDLLDKLSDQARNNERFRQLYDLRNSSEDSSQRILNALEPETQFKVHRHPTTCTTIIVIRGAIKHNVYDDMGRVVESVVLKAGTDCSAYQLEKGRWHNIESLESGTVIFEGKDGKYDPLTDTEFLEK